MKSWKVKLNEISPREKFIQESLKQYCINGDNERIYNQRGLYQKNDILKIISKSKWI